MIEIKYSVDMHCASCANVIEKALKGKVKTLKTNPALKIIKVSFDESKISSADIIGEIKKVGYDAQEK